MIIITDDINNCSIEYNFNAKTLTIKNKYDDNNNEVTIKLMNEKQDLQDLIDIIASIILTDIKLKQ